MILSKENIANVYDTWRWYSETDLSKLAQDPRGLRGRQGLIAGETPLVTF